MKIPESILRALVVSRPVFWLVAPAAYIYGALSGGAEPGPLMLLEAILLTFPLGIYVFGINDLFDMESDRANPRRTGSVWGARVTDADRGWIARASVLSVSAIMIAAAASGQATHIISVALFLPFPYLYSVPPFRLKSRPVIDSLSNATYTFGPYAMGYSLAGGFGFLNLPAILLALVFSAAHAVGTVMDLEGDRKAGIRTFASACGPRAAAAFAVLLLAINLPFAYGAMKSFFIVLMVYLIASLAVFASPRPDTAKKAFIAMNISFAAWIAYAAGGFLTGLWGIE